MIKPLLLRLYPRAWRERYGVELQALVDDAPPRVGDHWDLLKGAVLLRVAEPFRLFAFALAGVTICNAVIFAWCGFGAAKLSDAVLTLPPGVVQPTDLNGPLMRILDPQSVRDLIQRHDLLEPHPSADAAVISVWRHFRISPLPDRRLLIGFADSDPIKAQAIASELAQMLARQLNARIERVPGLGRPPEVLGSWMIAASLLGLLAGVFVAYQTRPARC